MITMSDPIWSKESRRNTPKSSSLKVLKKWCDLWRCLSFLFDHVTLDHNTSSININTNININNIDSNQTQYENSEAQPKMTDLWRC